jgi:glutaminyl-peptide cyclotransferase
MVKGLAAHACKRLARGVMVAALVASVSACAAGIPVYGYRVVKRYPHDTNAFTEGLFYRRGLLYESTGEQGASTVREVDLQTGKVLRQARLSDDTFGEGIVDWRGRLVQLTWRQHRGIVWDLATFRPLASFSYAGEGWALTRSDTHIYMSDGSPDLRVLDPDTLKQVGTVHVTADGRPVRMLNELEWVKGQIWANIWQTDRIARIDPKTGHVVGWIDLKGIYDVSRTADPDDDVLNGIAYDPVHDRVFVTGKCWPWLYQIELVRRSGAAP